MEQLKDAIASVPALADVAPALAALAAFAGVALLAWLSNAVLRRLIAGTVKRLITESKSTRDDILVRRAVFERLSLLAPALVVHELAPLALADYAAVSGFVVLASRIALVLIVALFLDALINAGVEIYGTFRISRDFPMKSFAQVAKLAIYLFTVIAVLSLILGESPLTFLAGLGAMAAVFMFVFKDPILGFVAGVQLSANRMVAVGDWIEIPSYNVDGDVMEIALTTVKIRNFDKTITTVPTQALINESFKNWRGMKETGGRRIKRSINIDISSIRIADEEMLKRYQRIRHIADYLDEKQAEISEYNAGLGEGADLAALANGRRLTNVGTYRAYIEAYLKAHPKISKSLTFLVRQLPPGPEGLPIEIYVFSLETDWIAYEKLQADIFDHLLAIAGEFDLRVYQKPAGGDLRRLAA